MTKLAVCCITSPFCRSLVTLEAFYIFSVVALSPWTPNGGPLASDFHLDAGIEAIPYPFAGRKRIRNSPELRLISCIRQAENADLVGPYQYSIELSGPVSSSTLDVRTTACDDNCRVPFSLHYMPT
ncbi:hypothetical protein F5Y05DRAFT_67730 [Hypoxylon sp. FL0543]|nr:hypothetical protein F5Y05DRAFT_67730 [Hypoxylon sp. FL0543]